MKLSDFDKVKLIGRGAYGEVQLVRRGVCVFICPTAAVAPRSTKAPHFLFLQVPPVKIPVMRATRGSCTPSIHQNMRLYSAALLYG